MPATLTVTSAADAGPGTLRQALVDAASVALPGHDDIVFQEGLGAISLTSGQLTIDSPVTITGPDAKITVRRDSSAAEFRIFAVLPGVDAALENLAITGGSQSQGGGIYNSGRLTVRSSTISGNSAYNGGAVCNIEDGPIGATVSFESSTISGNSAGSSGGAVYSLSVWTAGTSVSFESSTIADNSAPYGGGVYNYSAGPALASLAFESSTLRDNTATYYGGGVYNYSTGSALAKAAFESSTIAGNAANNSGGGVYNSSSGPAGATAAFESSTIRGNTATYYGGGVYNIRRGYSAGTAASSATFTATRIEENTATGGYGGGVYSTKADSSSPATGAATTTFESSVIHRNRAYAGAGLCVENASGSFDAGTIDDNTATTNGGGIYARASQFEVRSATIVDNRAGRGGGAYVDSSATPSPQFTVTSSTIAYNAGTGGPGSGIASVGAPTRLDNTIVSNNARGGAADDLSGAFAGSTNVVPSGSYSGLSGTITADPNLGVFGIWGGPTPVFPLGPGSSAIDAGDASLLPDGTLYDQRGEGYDRVARGGLDIGAFELPADATVTGVDSTAADGGHGAGSTIVIDVTFSDYVQVTGTPVLALDSGGVATYFSTLGKSLRFRYVVAAGESSADLDVASASALGLAGGSIRSYFAYAADLTLPTGAAAGSLATARDLAIDTTAPTVAGLDSTTADGAYGEGATILIDVTFSEAVAVAGAPTLALSSGGVATYLSGSGTSTLRFAYAVAAGEDAPDLDAASASALGLAGGSIVDLVGVNPNAAGLALPVGASAGSLASTRDLAVDTTAPTVLQFRVLFGSMSYDLIGSSRPTLPWTITGVRVVFSEPLATGGLGSLDGLAASGFSGLGTDELTWTFDGLTRGTFEAALVGAGANALRDAAGNPLGDGLGFARTFSVLYGDYTSDAFVSSADMTGVRLAGTAGYDVFADLNGDGVVDARDALIARGRIGARL